ncbi:MULTISPECIES: hypothetical protein [Enterococcus]|uniref:hypothetical protein n=1 Tax=Enterococcus TaxID=1350 RepID=UPI001E5381E0|nr:hypothetical protein [Enterococcus faecalis]MCU2262985.1 hypothetical protein [Enterococcus faecalis]MDG4628679.1 hypothetical protein [Enterococcus faecalis]MDG4631501.1 hypothetical protein [Enterococcus faecalis]GMC12561.1 hypothetical protein L3D_20070 [Enterococcus faecalis]
MAGTVNYWAQGGGLSDIPIVNNIPYIKDILSWIDEKHTFLTEEDKRNWLNEQYENYGKHVAYTTDKDYRIGVRPESGSPSFNPKTINK